MQLLCGACRQTTDVEAAEAGQVIACSHCGHEITVPDFDAEVKPRTSKSARDRADGEADGFAEKAREAMSRSPKIHLNCGLCGEEYLTVGIRLAGKQARCPACGGQHPHPMPDAEQDFELEALATAATGQSDLTLLDNPSTPEAITAQDPTRR